MNICIFGDSITWGAFLPFRVGWANLLRNYLESRNQFISLYDLGIDADTTRDVLERFDVESAARSPELILFAVGVNDSCYRRSEDNPAVPKDEFKKNIKELADRALEKTEKVAFVGLAKGDDDKTNPLPRSTTGKCYTKERVKAYNAILKEVCESKGLVFVEVFDVMRDEDFDDGLHPNINGHVKIFEAVRQSLLEGGFLE